VIVYQGISFIKNFHVKKLRRKRNTQSKASCRRITSSGKRTSLFGRFLGRKLFWQITSSQINPLSEDFPFRELPCQRIILEESFHGREHFCHRTSLENFINRKLFYQRILPVRELPRQRSSLPENFPVRGFPSL